MLVVSWLYILLLFWQVFNGSDTTIQSDMRKNKTNNFKLYLTNDKNNIIFLLCYLQQRGTLSKHYLRLLFIFKDFLGFYKNSDHIYRCSTSVNISVDTKEYHYFNILQH